jgi:integrase
MGAAEVTAFLNHLAYARRIASSTQNQALAALLFLYRELLDIQLPWLDSMARAKTPKRLPTVLTRAEAQAILSQLSGTRTSVRQGQLPTSPTFLMQRRRTAVPCRRRDPVRQP